jgi:hypothetical protein
MRASELPLGPCVCGHPAGWHGDRAIGFCIREDSLGYDYNSTFGRTTFYVQPRCGKCQGYQEDLRDLYRRVMVAFRPPVTILPELAQ